MRLLAAVAAGVVSALGLTGAAAQEKIQDNSFLIEEAYNQEDGVIQHIQTFQWDRSSRTWVYSFTQEWPTPRQKHQLSFTVPLMRSEPSRTDLGDVLLNYRCQAVLTERFAFSPRLSLVLNTGRWQSGYGKGGLGVQIGLPVSADLSKHVTVHLNVGATWTPRAAGVAGVRRTTLDTSAGGSAVLHLSATFDMFVEVIGARVQSVRPDGSIDAGRAVFLNPGFRFAINRPSGLQIVPGLAYTVGVGPSSGNHFLFAYLSFEHPLSWLKKKL
jgi:hypothetical protein